MVPGTRGTLISPLNLELQETIRLDLERAHFLHETIGPVAYKAVVDALRRVLFKFGSRNAEVGYCQGMDRLGATLLVYVEEEECLLGLTMIIEGKMWWQNVVAAASAWGGRGRKRGNRRSVGWGRRRMLGEGVASTHWNTAEQGHM